MKHSFFISHYSGDKDVAELIARTLRRISLNQLNPWFSSDTTEVGGLRPGDMWFTEIIGRLSESKAIIIILTPYSIEKHWLYFESGVAEALKNCSIIPVCVGIRREDIFPPLGLYQCYQLSDYRSLKEFIGKVLARFQISFDEEMAKPVLEVMLKELLAKSFDDIHANQKKEPDFTQMLGEIKEHFDRRYIDLIEKLNSNVISDNKPLTQITIPSTTFTLTLNIKFPKYQSTQYIEVRQEDSVGDVLDPIFFLISSFISPFTYLEKWVIRNSKTEMFF